MSGLHLHLVLAHLPVIGVILGTLLLLIGMFRKSRSLQQTGLALLVVSGLAAAGTYLTGEGAEEMVENRLSGAETLVEHHEEAALIGLVLLGVTAVVATLTLILGWTGRPLSGALVTVTILLGLASSGTFAWVANLGGQIGHPEIRSGGVSIRSGEGEDREH